MTQGEVWKDISLIPYHQAEWPYHQVSNRGRIRVLPGGRVVHRIVKEIEIRKLTMNESENKYMMLRQGKSRLYVHHLVLNQFLGPCPPGQVCRHLNGDPSDNRWPENIIWGTPEENEQDKIRHGTSNHGERNGRRKLTRAQVDDIKKSQASQNDLAKQYNISQQTISLIRNDKRWRENRR